MANYHIVGITEKGFFDSVGTVSRNILDALQPAFFQSVQAARRDPTSYTAMTIMEVLSVASFETRTTIAGAEWYLELFYLNNPARAICEGAGINLRFIRTCTTDTLPQDVGVLVRLPLHLHRQAVAGLS
jgi:hypothetical protein